MFASIFVRSLQSDLQIGFALLFQERDSQSRLRAAEQYQSSESQNLQNFQKEEELILGSFSVRGFCIGINNCVAS